ncbi:ABC transporter ATP-binding protein [Paenibacillus sp. YN15]|uniref:ABC transporter ATP-binding protein n=1 Tax=Paenibacillus sp. YN15 TaxID=1742774 RepID=UPI000DCE0A25|nr:ATP-binding cassette domain-containing protein [Paenibacillus sp. YN15]RAV01025.1 ABC transporter ATP-binding protein [Paenibacillus sp. YN15]
MLKVRHVKKAYGGLKVMDDFSLELEEGLVHCLFGPSGCGKTTLLRLLAGLAAPDEGSIGTPEGADRAMVFQEDRLLPWLTVRENIAYALESRIGRSAALAEADRCGGQVGLGAFLGALPGQLSGGMQRRVAIARALACRAELLFLDEPFKGLDYSLKQELMGLVQELCSRGRQTILLVTHDPEEAYCLADWVHMVEGPPLSVVKQLDVAAFRKTLANGAEAAGLQQFRALLMKPGAVDQRH